MQSSETTFANAEHAPHGGIWRLKRAEKAKLGLPVVTSHMNSNVKSDGGANMVVILLDTFSRQIFKKIPGALKLLHVNDLDGYKSASAHPEWETAVHSGLIESTRFGECRILRGPDPLPDEYEIVIGF